MLVVGKKARTWSGAKLRGLRLAKGWTQAKLADEAKIYPADVSTYERDKAEPSFTTLCQLAEALEVDLNAFAPNKSGSADEPHE